MSKSNKKVKIVYSEDDFNIKLYSSSKDLTEWTKLFQQKAVFCVPLRDTYKLTKYNLNKIQKTVFTKKRNKFLNVLNNPSINEINKSIKDKKEFIYVNGKDKISFDEFFGFIRNSFAHGNHNQIDDSTILLSNINGCVKGIAIIKKETYIKIYETLKESSKYKSNN